MPTSTPPALQIRGLSHRYGPVTALDHLDLTLSRGELLVVAGPDGAGKTTLARLAAGALRPTTGRIDPDPRGRTGFLPAGSGLYPDLTVWENLLFYARLYGVSTREATAEATRLLEWVGLAPFQQRLASQLSGGMRQKLALLCAVIHRPPVLVLDEPTTAVDPLARHDFWQLLRQQSREGRAILVTTPYLEEAERGDRAGLLHQGRLLALDTPASLKSRLPLRVALLVPSAEPPPPRSQLLAAARQLPGVHWAYPVGQGVRLALADPLAPVPAGYRLEPAAPTMEDVYVWLSESRGGEAR